MRWAGVRALGVAAMLATLLAAGAAAARPYGERVSETTLDNGLKLIMLEDHKAPVVVFQLYFRVGSRNERLGYTGLSHILEHITFKGTEKVAPEEYSKIIQRNGGRTNAFTSQDNTTYFAMLASDRVGVVIDLEADRLAHLKVTDAQFLPERDVILEERRLRVENDPVGALFEQLSATAYAAHPYQFPIIGWSSDIAQATLADVLRYHATYYVPNNAFIVAVGDFDSAALTAQIRDAFEPIERGPLPPAVRAIEPPQHGARRVELERPAQLPFVAMAYHVPNLQSPDASALEVLSAILAGGDSARLHDELVYRSRLARSVGVSYDYTAIDPGLFTVYAQPLPGRTAAQSEAALGREIERIRRESPSPRELEKAKNGIESSFVFAQDSLFYQGMLLGEYELAGDWRRIDDYLPGVRAVSADDIRRVAQAYLSPTNRTTAVLIPNPPIEGPIGGAPPSAGGIN
ncbi:MAG TPA: pitrilysin family protein [Candidatus Dormibacteraeota bacterium]|nr:pitrilysin family protein [Candidatus Dormibacteraeota bacterium]